LERRAWERSAGDTDGGDGEGETAACHCNGKCYSRIRLARNAATLPAAGPAATCSILSPPFQRSQPSSRIPAQSHGIFALLDRYRGPRTRKLQDGGSVTTCSAFCAASSRAAHTNSTADASPPPPPDSSRDANPNAAAAAAAASAAASASAALPPSQAAALVGWEDLGEAWAADGNAAFLAKLLALSGGLAYAAKYLPALVAGVQVSDELLGAAAGAVIVVPTALNCAKWLQRSKEGAEFVGDI